MTVSEALKLAGYYSTVPAFQFACSEKLRQDLMNHPDANMRFFHKVCTNFVQGGNDPWHPDRIAAVAKMFTGSELYSDLEKWSWGGMNPSFNAMEFMDILRPPLILDPKPIEVPNTDIVNAINQCPHLQGSSSHVLDGKYQLLAERSQCLTVLEKTPSHRFSWESESRDCDGMMKIARGYLAEQNLDNLTVGGCVYMGFNSAGALVRHHAVLLFMYLNASGEIAFMVGDPQTSNEIWDVGDPEPGWGITQTHYTNLFF